MRWLLNIFIFISVINSIFAKDASGLQRLGEAELPESIRQLFTDLVRAELEDDYHLFFLNKESATRYVEKIFAETEYAQDIVKRDAMAATFLTMSSQSASFVSLYLGNLQTITITDAKMRQGATEQMKVWVVNLDFHFEDGSTKALELNLVETDQGYRILNVNLEKL